MDNNKNINKKFKIQDLANFIHKMSMTNTWHEEIVFIFELHLKHDESSYLHRNTADHIEDSFNVNPDSLFNYFCMSNYINLESFGIKSNINKQNVEFINKLKRKYGSFFKNLIIAEKNPLMLKAIQTTIEEHGRSHFIKFIRTDEITLNSMVTSESLMQFLSTLTNTLKSTMENGIYTVKDKILSEYIETNKEMQKFLEEAKKEDSVQEEV